MKRDWRGPIGVELTAGIYFSFSAGCSISFTEESLNSQPPLLSQSNFCPCPEDSPENPYSPNNFHPNESIPVITPTGITGPAGNNSSTGNGMPVISGSSNTALAK
jgi:hypothetical protein